MKKIFTLAFAAMVFTAAIAQAPKAMTIKGGVNKAAKTTLVTKKVSDKAPVKANATIEKAPVKEATLTGAVKTQMAVAPAILPLATGAPAKAPVAAAIDDVVGNFKVSAESALQNGGTTSGSKLTITKKSATELTITGVTDVDVVGTYADGVLTIPITYVGYNEYNSSDVYWGAWNGDKAVTYKNEVQATWTGSAFEFAENELIGEGLPGLGYFALDSNYKWVVDEGPVKADINDILGNYSIKAVSGLVSGKTVDGNIITIASEYGNEVTIYNWAPGTVVKGTYADGILTIAGQEASYGEGIVSFGGWDALSSALKDETKAEWDGSKFAFDAKEYIGFGLEGIGWYTLDRSVELIKRPDGDFSVNIEVDGTRTSEDNMFSVILTAGQEATDLRFMILNGDWETSDLDPYATTLLGQSVVAGNYSINLNDENPEEQYYGPVTLYLASVDADGNVMESTVKYLFAQDYNEDNWISLGNALYTDDIMNTLLEYEPDELLVEIQQSKADPTAYRMKNVYGEQSSWYDIVGMPWDHYINYNITENGLAIALSPIGALWNMDLDGNGVTDYDSFVTSLQYAPYTNNIVEFPTKGLLFMTTDGLEEGNGYYANISGEMKLVLPGQLTVTVTNNGEPAANAIVSIDEEDYNTDADGKVVINIDAAGDKVYDCIVALGSDEQEFTVDFKANGKAALDVEFGTNAISEINTDAATADAPVYNLAGQRVSDNVKGLLIKNGKKFINKK